MVIAYHVVFSTYGFWLPNDPRGSGSTVVRMEHLQPFGPATGVSDNRSRARDPHDAALRAAAKRALYFPPVTFDGLAARSVANGFARCVVRTGAAIHACAILPNHVHMVIARHRYEVEKLVGFLKADATRQLIADRLHPLASYAEPEETPPSCWARGCRKVFLNSREQVLGRIDYVEMNPIKEGKPRQRWNLVQRFEVQ